MVSSGLSSDLQTPRLSERVVSTHFERSLSPIVVYPEILPGNPLNAPFVVRYILNFAGLLGGPENFAPDEYLLSYAKGLNPSQGEQERTLFFPASDTSIFHPPANGTGRSGTCYYAGKYKYLHKGKLFPETTDSLEITRGLPNSQTPKEIAEIFRRSESFYCYENSALSLEAALCGCPVILLPNEHFKSIIANQELGNDGIAWGISPVEVARARATVSRVWTNYQQLQKKLEADLKMLVQETQEIAATKTYSSQIRMLDPFEFMSNSSSAKLRRLAKLLLSVISSPPGPGELKSFWIEVRANGFSGVKRKLKERETRLGLRYTL